MAGQHSSRVAVRGASTHGGAALLAAALALAGCATSGPGPVVRGGPVQAYVSAALLVHWCQSSEAVDVEACLSYLRGHFDTLAMVRADSPAGGGVESCIPATAAITELRERVRERAADSAADRALPAARMLVQLWRTRYGCAAGAAGVGVGVEQG